MRAPTPTYNWWRLSPPPLRHHQLHRSAREIFSFVGGALGLVIALLPCMRGTSQSRRVGNPARAGKHDDLILSICIALFLSDQQTRNDLGAVGDLTSACYRNSAAIELYLRWSLFSHMTNDDDLRAPGRGLFL